MVVNVGLIERFVLQMSCIPAPSLLLCSEHNNFVNTYWGGEGNFEGS